MRFKYIDPAKQAATSCFVDGSSGDLSWLQDGKEYYIGKYRYRLVHTDLAGEGYDGFSVWVGTDQETPVEAKSHTRWIVSSSQVGRLSVEAEWFEIDNGVLFFHGIDAQLVAAFLHWDYVKRDTP